MNSIDRADVAGNSATSAKRAPVEISLLAAAAGCLFACRSIFVLAAARWINFGTEPGVIASFGLELALLIVVLVASYGPNTPMSQRMFQAASMRWVLAYIAFAGCSLVWSEASSPANSAVYWLGLVLDVFIVILLCRALGQVCASHSMMYGFIAGSVALGVVAWIIPAAEDLRLGDLEYFNTNQIANICAFAILMCMLLASRGEEVPRFIAPFLAITLFRSLSKATIIAFIASQVYRLVSDSAMGSRKKWLLVASSAVLTICFWGLLDAYFGAYTSTGNQAETLTGRTAIWAWSLDAGLSNPWFGNGFDAMWKIAPPFGGDLFEARHAENELLQQFFAYGVCGVALLVGIYGSLYRRSRSLPPGSERSIFISILLFVVVRGIAEAEPFDLLLPLWFIAALSPLLEKSNESENRKVVRQSYLSDESAAAAL